MANWLSKAWHWLIEEPPAPEAKAVNYGPSPIFLPHPVTLGTLVHGPGAAEIYRDAYGGGAYWNSIVYSCLTAIYDGYAEARLRLYRTGPDGKPEPVVVDAWERLLRKPNPAMTRIELDRHINYGKHIHGNAYVRKVRAASGEVTELWPISPTAIWPVRERGSTNFIDFYRYQWGSGEREREDIPVEDIVHFRMGVDDRDHMVGAAPIRAVMREILGDNNAAAFLDRMFRNQGVPGLVVSLPVEAGDPGPDAAEVIKAGVNRAFTGEGQGSTAILTGGAQVEQFGFNPQQLELRAVRMTPEERICAAFRVMPGYVGVGAGLERNTFSNSAEQRQQFSENTIIPLYRADDAVWSAQLLPEFTRDESVYAAHDIAELRALQPDLDAEFARLTLAVGGPWLTVNEARGEVGFPDSTDDGADMVGGAPEPAPEAQPPDAADAAAPTPLRAARSVKALNPRDYEATLRALAAGQEGPLEAALQTYLAGLKRRVVARYREGA